MDVNGDGVLDCLGWVFYYDGMLVFDCNGNGEIDSVGEIFFVNDLEGVIIDLEGFCVYDSNGDGWLSVEDVCFSEF